MPLLNEFDKDGALVAFPMCQYDAQRARKSNRHCAATLLILNQARPSLLGFRLTIDLPMSSSRRH